MQTLLEFLPRIRDLGEREATRYWDGARTEVRTYAELYAWIGAAAAFLRAAGLGRGDHIILWSEGRPEWIAVFWAAVSRGLPVVPVDPHSSLDRVRRMQEETGARLLVRGAATAAGAAGIPELALDGVRGLPPAPLPPPEAAAPGDVVEILYTSGTTSEPKGVVHRHRNICANLTPIAREIDRYRRWARPFQPIRFLNLLPLSHMFGQSMGLFTPVLVGGSTVFTNELHPAAVRETVRRQRVSVLVTTPRVLGALQADVARRHPLARAPQPDLGVLRRWWRHRGVHRDFGWKFWAFVVGGATLEREAEEFWARLGLLVVQGYGLTETSPVVAVNHPFHARRGTLGRAVGGQEIRIAADGEILVRGASVVEEYLQGGERLPSTDAEGWFHTGDIGALDAEGRLLFRGRKKDVIVTAEGLNVHPEDVERALNRVPGVLESAVVPAPGPYGERPHAALRLESGTRSPEEIVRRANETLEPEQRIASWSVWPEPEFPRTPSTGKIQRRMVAARITGAAPPGPAAAAGRDPVRETLAEVLGRPAPAGAEARLAEDLGVSSLERIDLLTALETAYGVEIDEADFSAIATVGELAERVDRARMAPAGGAPARPGGAARILEPRWSRWAPVRLARRLLQAAVIRPLLARWARVEPAGAGALAGVTGPVLFASTHHSHLDTPIILAALPPRWRRLVAPAMLQEHFFAAGTRPRFRRLYLAVEYFAACGGFNAYPLPQRLGHVRDSLRYTGELVDAGYCPLIFPEGVRAPEGGIAEFRPGVGFLATRLRIPVAPIRLEGSGRILAPESWWPRRGRVRVVFGPLLQALPEESYPDFTRRLEQTIRGMA